MLTPGRTKSLYPQVKTLVIVDVHTCNATQYRWEEDREGEYVRSERTSLFFTKRQTACFSLILKRVTRCTKFSGTATNEMTEEK
jgi:hypothetical protein